MKLADFNRLKKLMGLTFSENDPEALSALRAANAILAKDALTWDRVLDRVVQILPEVEEGPVVHEPPAHRRAAPSRPGSRNEIEEAFAVLDAADDLGDFQDFIDSLRRQYEENLHLSDKQKRALFRAADRERNR